MSSNHFLDLACKVLHKGRLAFPENVPFTMQIERQGTGGSVEIWFRTQGCRHSHAGGCTMCNYWTSAPATVDQMITSVQAALNTVEFHPDLLMVNPFGSMFDEWEVPPRARRAIFELLSRVPPTSIAFETRADTISDDKVSECTRILRRHYVAIELGVESSDPWISRYCVNKALSIQDIRAAVIMVRRAGLFPIANILIGTPFLTFHEMVDDAISSLNWAFAQGFERCVVFPVCIKPSTLVARLEEMGLYTQPSLWALVDVLSGLHPVMLPRTEVVWYKPPVLIHPDCQIPSRSPVTCPKCYGIVVSLFDAYRRSHDRRGLIEQLNSLKCRCRDAWYRQVAVEPTSPLGQRVKATYQVIGQELLDPGWWLQNGEAVLASIPDHDLRTVTEGN